MGGSTGLQSFFPGQGIPPAQTGGVVNPLPDVNYANGVPNYSTPFANPTQAPGSSPAGAPSTATGTGGQPGGDFSLTQLFSPQMMQQLQQELFGGALPQQPSTPPPNPFANMPTNPFGQGTQPGGIGPGNQTGAFGYGTNSPMPLGLIAPGTSNAFSAGTPTGGSQPGAAQQPNPFSMIFAGY